MKQYYKLENGNKIWLGRVIELNGKQIFNPTEAQIAEAGYIVDKDEVISNSEILENIKRGKALQVESYDKSEAVNTFYINGMQIWIDRDERLALKRRFELEKANGKTESTFWRNKVEFPLVIDNAILMLDAIEMYAIECYDVTQRHLMNIDKLQTAEEVAQYDYTVNYPEYLRF